MSKPSVVIFNSLLLPPSQTFVRNLGEKLQDFTPYYVGSRYVRGLTLPKEHTLVVNQGDFRGKAEEALFKIFGFAPKLYREVKQLNPVLIHAQFGLSASLALPLARTLKLPLLVHFRGADATQQEDYVRYSSINHWVYYQRCKNLQTEARLFIAVSKFIREKLLEQGFPNEKIIVNYDGIDIKKFQPDASVLREPVVLFVGRLVEKKGCKYLIEAMAKVQSVAPDVELVIIGDGPLRKSLEEQASKLLHRYQFLGVQAPDVVQSWMNRARLLVASSVTATDGDSEGLPTVVVEAQAMGLPVVSTIHAGIPEAVIHGKTGFLVPERDFEGLAKYILWLLEDSTLWQLFSFEGQEHIQANFDSFKQAQVLEKIYQEVFYHL